MSALAKDPRPLRWVLFTDLDGTLLDAQSYSWKPAQPALEALARREVPLVFCSSKTSAEVEALRRELSNQHPFVTENGGGVFVPQGYFGSHLPQGFPVGSYRCLALATPYERMINELERIAKQAGVEVVGFHQMDARDVAASTGLPLPAAKLALQRDFDEPFFFVRADPPAEARFIELARERGLELVRGGRFWHLFQGSDKGRAVRKLMELYMASTPPRLRFAAFGDSANDLPMLAAVDHAFLLPRPDGSFDREVLASLPQITCVPSPGPVGWNQAVLELLAAGR
ncbi:MAG: HAD-IIB family hydrolase [Acidobacteria bacterium]|nr:HAD-IIB family hydrolase [Acidobacteriota bacterium]